VRNPIIIGSRGSDLALWQAHFVQNELKSIGLEAVIHIIKTKGDTIQHLSFDKIEGKGFFTKEIEEALLNNSIDIAVHSHKDLETTSPEGLIVAAVSHRADARELLLVHPRAFDQEQILSFKKNAVIGTSSARRKAQISHIRPDISISDIRGNVPTRVQKLRDGHFDAILLAKAGVDRLQLDVSDLHVIIVDENTIVPAPAQGVLAIQCRTSDSGIIQQLQAINHQQVQHNIHIERQVLSRLQGGCQLPLGVHAVYQQESYHVKVAFARQWDAPLMRFEVEGKQPEQLIADILDRIAQQ